MTLKCSLWSLLGPEPHIKLRDNRKKTAATVRKKCIQINCQLCIRSHQLAVQRRPKALPKPNSAFAVDERSLSVLCFW
jgi:hypothetical protein